MNKRVKMQPGIERHCRERKREREEGQNEGDEGKDGLGLRYRMREGARGWTFGGRGPMC